MMFRFPTDGEVLILRKIPKKNIIEARIAGKIILYERGDQEVEKISEETDSHEPGIVDLIKQYFVSNSKHNRWKKVGNS
jgi:hypothetical protein